MVTIDNEDHLAGRFAHRRHGKNSIRHRSETLKQARAKIGLHTAAHYAFIGPARAFQKRRFVFGFRIAVGDAVVCLNAKYVLLLMYVHLIDPLEISTHVSLRIFTQIVGRFRTRGARSVDT
jgi:hypothetical protein